jgi:hypothetical protein
VGIDGIEMKMMSLYVNQKFQKATFIFREWRPPNGHYSHSSILKMLWLLFVRIGRLRTV